MNANVINNNKSILEPLIENAILNAVKWIEIRCRPQEPDYMLALSTQFIKEFFNILVAVFPSYDFSVSSVYCHQKPIVDIGLDKKPELGDILFVYAERRKNGERILNALLLQAKVSNYPLLRIHQSEKHQLELYRRWPEFTYYRAGFLNGKKRNVLPKTINDGAQYLLIGSNPLTNGIYLGKGMFPMGCAVPDDDLCINNSLSRELINLLKFKSGRTIDSNPYSTEDGWSKVIWDLLRIAAFKYSKRKNAQVRSFPRSSEYNHFHTENMGTRTLLDEALGNYADIMDMGEENSGVSVVLVESMSKREQE